jgi:hypothetical protein
MRTASATSGHECHSPSRAVITKINGAATRSRNDGPSGARRKEVSRCKRAISPPELAGHYRSAWADLVLVGHRIGS